MCQTQLPKLQIITCNVHIEEWMFSGNEARLPPNEVYELTIDYPLEYPAKVRIRTGKKGLGFGGLMTKIVNAYHKVYENGDRYGIWGHDIGDLDIGEVAINHKKKSITLRVSS